MENDEIGVLALRSDRDVVPAEIIVLQMTLEPPPEPALARGHPPEEVIEGRDQGRHDHTP